ncbi:hypothetical protein B5X24_HaOG214932 [Helicoverpa armigera]|uniref:Uncharacterized protein n=1 Tax=Helicoverpa armigera TaxID=29058 RepID=A0A2W1B624_HELAM|nr:hypothetical protein B5X24_HaOG214932 [Helicoverpa armigera]
MAPKTRERVERFRCDDETQLHGEPFHAQTDDVFKYNWWEVFCFPYILCARLWDCCCSICAGANQCLVYWMMIQWLVCKITRLTTPDPIIFPYYFYVFCQVFLLTAFFILLWHWFGRTVVIPYFYAFYEAFVEDMPNKASAKNRTRMSFRKYCFRKGEIFDTPVDGSFLNLPSRSATVMTLLIEVLVNDILR